MGVRIVHIDLAEPLLPIRTGRGRTELWILVKLALHPVGWLKCRPGQFGKVISPELLSRLISEQLSREVFDAARQRGSDLTVESDAPSVSLIIPTRNNAPALKRLLASLVWLKYLRFEVIVVDNAPKDDATRDVCAQFDFVHHVVEPRPGIPYARNTGWQVARNDIVAYLDDTSIVDPQWLTAMTANYADPRVDCVAGAHLPSTLDTTSARIVERSPAAYFDLHRRFFAPGAWNTSIWLDLARSAAQTNFSVRRSAIAQMNGFDPALDRGGVLDLFTRVLRDGAHLIHDPRALALDQRRLTVQRLHQQAVDFGFSLAVCCSKFFHDAELANSSAITLRRWVREQALTQLKSNLFAAVRLQPHFPVRLILLELAGALLAAKAYRRGVRHVKTDSLRFRQKGMVRKAA